LRLHLINEWNAYECVGFEADDMCGVEQKEDGSTCIVAIDKDLLQVPGLHYSWPIIRKNTIVREGLFREISKEEGMRRFFTQALTGDTSDNIKGIYGIGAKKAEKLLAECHTEEEMYEVCLNTYTLDGNVKLETQRFQRNCDLLWIWRELGITYSIRREIYGI
jgi:5'-3' exonuclease